MKKTDIKIGSMYTAKIGANLTTVRIESESQYGGWNAVNLVTNKAVRIKSAAKLRAETTVAPEPQKRRKWPAKVVQAEAAADQEFRAEDEERGEILHEQKEQAKAHTEGNGTAPPEVVESARKQQPKKTPGARRVLKAEPDAAPVVIPPAPTDERLPILTLAEVRAMHKRIGSPMVVAPGVPRGGWRSEAPAQAFAAKLKAAGEEPVICCDGGTVLVLLPPKAEATPAEPEDCTTASGAR